MKRIVLAAAMFACCSGLAVAQMDGMHAPKDGKPVPSPRKMATADLQGTKIDISYGAPSLRGRKMVGEKDPYGKVWRLGANEATSFKTTGDVMIAGHHVPAGSYTLFALPTAESWTLIVSKATGEWGLDYKQDQDLVRIKMMKSPMTTPQEQMSITFEKTAGKKTEMHVKWDRDNMWVPIVTM